MPHSESYRDSHKAPGKGTAYDALFRENPYRSMVWDFEKRALNRIVAEFLGNCEIQHLDFACGTGRILAHLEGRVARSVGVDVSQTMLEVARNNCRRSELCEADITRDDTLGDFKFNLITAFRFFPNAEAELRKDAMRTLSKHLDDTGVLVFNNHKNTGSLRNGLARLFGRRNFKGMSVSDVKSLLAENGLEIVKVHHFSVFPASEKRPLLPGFFLRPIERFLAGIPIFRYLGENILFVCKRAKVI